MQDLVVNALLALVGLAGGVIAGLVGLAGGIFIVPAIVAIYGTAGMNDAITISFFAVLFNSLSSSRANLKAIGTKAYWKLIQGATWYTGGAICASLVVGILFGVHKNAIPKEALAGLQMMLGLCMLIPRTWYEHYNFKHRNWKDANVGTVVGGVSTLIGVGGGTYTIFYFLIHGRDIKDCTLTANFVGIFIGLMSTIGYYGYILFGLSANNSHHSVISTFGKIILVIAGIATAPIGVRLQKMAPAILIKRLIVLFLLASSSYVMYFS